jgi:F420-dependent oxidoreductase-like protein
VVEIAIMIEGQNGLNWDRWQRVARAVEDLGFAGLYRSDHYTNPQPPDKDSLELWTSLTWLASHTQRIEFGPLVTPLSFRHPTMTARMAAAVDDLSGGRLILGVGAGWQEREHENFGWNLLDVPGRFQRFEEGLEVITRLLESDRPVDFEGRYYHLKDARLLPRPQRPGGPPILVGGNGRRYTLPLAARYADEWNANFISAADFADLNARLDDLLREQGRPLNAVHRSLMTNCLYGRDDQEVKRLVKQRTQGKKSPKELRQRGRIVGTASQIVEQLGMLAEAGAQRVMLQWLTLDDIDRLESMAAQVLPQMGSH